MTNTLAPSVPFCGQSSPARVLPPSAAANWYAVDRVSDIVGLSLRTVRARIASAPDNCKRFEPQERGRPRLMIHCQALPQLAAYHAINGGVLECGGLTPLSSVASVPSVVNSSAPSPTALAVAELRLLAVKEFDAIAKSTGKRRALKYVADGWKLKPRTKEVRNRERLDGGHYRHEKDVVCLGGFAPDTLRNWVSIYSKAQSFQDALLALCPKHGEKGRTPLNIPDEHVEFVALLAISTVRADVQKAVAKAKPHLPPELQAVSVATWRRRILKLDPQRQRKSLMHSVSAFRKTLPDVSMDWDSLPYNGLWEIDDVEKDWYAYGSELQYLLRPHGYAILRARTRKWIAFAASETDITHDQVKALIGFALANPAGGIPDKIKFEHKTAAAKKEFANLLTSLGIEVGCISMDSGSSVAGLVADVAAGHPQGHSLIEANNRRCHNIEWDQALQVGPDERLTAPRRLEKIKAIAASEAKQGRFLQLPTPQQWYLTFHETMEKHNNTPHSGLPKIVDPETGKPRHMTPNECERSLADTAVKVMDERLIPLFHCRADEVPVTRNGFMLNTVNYGRFDEALKPFQTVHAFASVDYPSVAYVQELGRCVKAHEKADFNEDEQLEAKKHAEKKFRNAHEALVARVVSSSRRGVFDMLLASANPVPNRKTEIVCPPALLQDADALSAGIAAEQSRRVALAGRFASSDPRPSALSAGKGLLAREDDLDFPLPTNKEVS
jgi:hypothetical protein